MYIHSPYHIHSLYRMYAILYAQVASNVLEKMFGAFPETAVIMAKDEGIYIYIIIIIIIVIHTLL